MSRPFPLRFELPSPAKQLRVERYIGYADDHPKGLGLPTTMHMEPCWRLWLTANGDFTLGTFIQLLDNGTVNRVTWHEDGTESVLEVTDD
jgi:hypothetical protein